MVCGKAPSLGTFLSEVPGLSVREVEDQVVVRAGATHLGSKYRVPGRNAGVSQFRRIMIHGVDCPTQNT
jgi:hypothetical protein